MTFNSTPLRPITQQDRDAYAADGVVCLRQVFDPDWMKSLEPEARRIVVDGEDVGLLPNNPGRYMSRVSAPFRRFIFDSPVAQAAGEVMGSREIRFFFDEMFAKRPNSSEKTIWHTDRMGWPVTGLMVPSLWIPLGGVSQENCLECVAGTQVQETPYWLFSPNARQMLRPPERVSHPDGEALRADPANRFLQWDMEPGDMLVVHPRTIHYSHGNSAEDWRIALSVRVFGDDIVWAPRPDCVNLAGVSFDEMIPGEPPAGPMFPLLWSQDGRRDGDADFPRGFATRWRQGRRKDLNEYDTFAKLNAQQSVQATR